MRNNVLKTLSVVVGLFLLSAFVHADQSFLLSKNIPLWNYYPNIAVNPDNGDIMVVWTQMNPMDTSYSQIWAVKLQRKSSGKYKMRKAVNVSPDKGFYTNQRVSWVPKDTGASKNRIRDEIASGEFFSVFDNLDQYPGAKPCDIWGEILNLKTGKSKNPKQIISNNECNYTPYFLVASNNGEQEKCLYYSESKINKDQHCLKGCKLDSQYEKIDFSEINFCKLTQPVFVEKIGWGQIRKTITFEQQADGFYVIVFDEYGKKIDSRFFKDKYITKVKQTLGVDGENYIVDKVVITCKSDYVHSIAITFNNDGKITKIFDSIVGVDYLTFFSLDFTRRKSNNRNLFHEFRTEQDSESAKKTAIGYVVTASENGWAILEKVSDKLKFFGKKTKLFKHDGKLTFMDAQTIEFNSSDSDIDTAKKIPNAIVVWTKSNGNEQEVWAHLFYAKPLE